MSCMIQSYLWANSSIDFDYISPSAKDLGDPYVYSNKGTVSFSDIGVSITRSGRIWKKDSTVYVELPAKITYNEHTYSLGNKGDNVLEIKKDYARTHKIKF